MLGQWTVAAARNFKRPPKGLFTDLFIYLFYQLFRHKFEPVCKRSAHLCNSVISSHFATTLGLPAGKMIEGWFLVETLYIFYIRSMVLAQSDWKVKQNQIFESRY